MYLEQFQKQQAYSRSNLLNIRNRAVKESMTDFCDLSHRKELVAEVNGVYFYDDSRSLNTNATWFSFESISRQIVWIAYGSSTADYSMLKRFVNEHVETIVCLGRDNANLIEAFGRIAGNIVFADSIESAVSLAAQYARADDAVVFSPASRIENCELCGNQFQKAVNNL